MAEQHEIEQAEASAISGSEVKKLGYSLYVKIPADRLECRCSYVPHEQGSMITRDEFAGYLKQYNVREVIDQEAFDDFVIKAAAGQQLIDVLIASGTPPQFGADEHIDILVQPSTAIHTGDDEVTTVDMHIVQTFINVSVGDQIGRIIPAEPGIPGRNIMGLTVPTQAGKPLAVVIGKNIATEENGALLVAGATGRLCQSSGEISVEEEYLVKGDVNFRVGSINFKGVVEVRGDVLDNFDITASKGVTVSGNIGVCHIVSDGDITFCGMDGQGRGRIVCGGTLRAHFIHEVDIECAGDVIVDVEIHSCTIRTLGKIVVDKGAISGGSYIAKGGIEAKKLGSAASLHTRLRAGIDYHDADLLEQLFASLAEIQAQIKECHSLTDIVELRKTSAALSDNILAIRNKIDPYANAKINAKAVLYDNVVLALGATVEESKEQLDGSHSFIENSIDGGLRTLALTGLNVNARDIEAAYVREQQLAQRQGVTFP